MTVSVSQLKNSLSEYLNRAAYRRERIIIASRGTPKAAVIGIDDLLRLEDALAARGAVAAYEAEETISLDELEAELEEAASELTG